MKKTNDLGAAYRILKQDDLLIFESARDYEQSIIRECNLIKQAAINEADLFKQEVKEQALAEVHQQQQKLLSDLDKKLMATFSQLRDDLYLLIYKVLHEFGLFSHSPEQVKQIIFHELDKYDANIHDIVIYANSTTITKLRDMYGDLNDNLRLDELLQDDECILESKLYIFRVNLSVAITKIEQLFNKNKEITS